MKYLQILMFSWLSSNANANNCHQEFSEKDIIGSVKLGHSILYPFQFSRLVEGKDEPEIHSEALDIKSKETITKSVSYFYHVINKSKPVRAIDNVNESKIEIIYRGPNSGFYISTSFQRVNGCWYLAGLSNEST